MKRVFYDIESLSDLFTIAVWQPDGIPYSLRSENVLPYLTDPAVFHDTFSDTNPDVCLSMPTLDLYVLADNPDLRCQLHDDAVRNRIFTVIKEKNRALDYLTANRTFTIRLFDLSLPVSVYHLALAFGVGVNRGINETEKGVRKLSVAVQDADGNLIAAIEPDRDFPFDFETENPDHDTYIMGYNSYNYDTTMLAYYMARACNIDDSIDETKHIKDIPGTIVSYVNPTSITASELRDFNDTLFTKSFIRSMPMALRVTNPKKRAEIIQRHIDMSDAGARKSYMNHESVAHRLRQFWLFSGRHIDVARLNEKQTRVGLKRLLGVIGRQIFENDDVATGSNTDFARLLAYNTSDVIGTQFLFEDGEYRANFSNKSMILDEYPECIFQDRDNPNDINVSANKRTRKHLRFDRLRVDATSQQIISSVLCPNRNAPLSDKIHVDLTYPHPELATDKNPSRDVLDELCDWFYDTVLPSIVDEERAEAVYRFERMYQHYDYLRHVNLNTSNRHAEENNNVAPAYNDAGVSDENNPSTVNAPNITTCLMYYGADGRPTSCYATISEGGAHGAEYNKALYDADMDAYRKACAVQNRLRTIFACDTLDDIQTPFNGDMDATNMMRTGVKVMSRDYISDPATGEPIDFSDITPDAPYRMLKDVVMSKSNRKCAYWKPIRRPELFRMIRPVAATRDRLRKDMFPSQLDLAAIAHRTSADSTIDFQAIAAEIQANFPLDFFSDELNGRYTYTSAATTNHEDFASYYPNLLRQMKAFYNDNIKRDRYGDLYYQKQEFGAYQKDPTKAPDAERAHIADLSLDEQALYWKRRRNGVKLMINAGSGAGGATFDNAIRMNNNIMAMRMLGQMFIYRIGQAQALEGALVPSTNTDGLYTVMDEATNNALLAREEQGIGIDIEPERMELVSKDANNRVEYIVTGQAIDDTGAYHPENVKILSAGGSLSCYRSPSTAKSLDHPAVYDYTVAHYLIATKERGEKNGDIAHEFTKPFDVELARSIIEGKLAEITDPAQRVHVLRMFQTMLASSPGTFSYVVACDYDYRHDGATTDQYGLRQYHNVQQYNRAFFVRPGSIIPSTMADASPVVYIAKCIARKGATTPDEYTQMARELLAEQGHSDEFLRQEEGRLAAIGKFPGIADTQPIAIVNDDLQAFVDDQLWPALVNALDIDAYLNRIESIFTENWRNKDATSLSYMSVVNGSQAGEN